MCVLSIICAIVATLFLFAVLTIMGGLFFFVLAAPASAYPAAPIIIHVPDGNTITPNPDDDWGVRCETIAGQEECHFWVVVGDKIVEGPSIKFK